MTAKPDTIHTALAKAQGEMGRVSKTGDNKHFNSKYAELSDVLDACREPLTTNGISLHHEFRDIDGQRWLATIFTHGVSQTHVEIALPIILQKNDMQGLGSALTYARRYGLLALAAIAPENDPDDDDGNEAARNAPKPEPKPPLPGPSRAEIDAVVGDLLKADDFDKLRNLYEDLEKPMRGQPAVINAKEQRKAELTPEPEHPPIDDEIPFSE